MVQAAAGHASEAGLSASSSPRSPLDIVVLTSGMVGIAVAAELVKVPAARSVTIVTAPLGRGRTPMMTKFRTTYRMHGPRGIWDAAVARARQPPRATVLAELIRERCPGASHIHVMDLHEPAAIERIRALAPDLGIVAATYVLKPTVFTIPRLGSINLHLGRAPEFRGSSPAFYEMFQGVGEVGVTIHRVTEALDGGNILLQRTYPIDLAPPNDPIAYLKRYQWDVLVPNGARLMAEAVTQIADGVVEERMQDQAKARTYRHATYRMKKELRRIVAERRRNHKY